MCALPSAKCDPARCTALVPGALCTLSNAECDSAGCTVPMPGALCVLPSAKCDPAKCTVPGAYCAWCLVCALRGALCNPASHICRASCGFFPSDAHGTACRTFSSSFSARTRSRERARKPKRLRTPMTLYKESKTRRFYAGQRPLQGMATALHVQAIVSYTALNTLKEQLAL